MILILLILSHNGIKFFKLMVLPIFLKILCILIIILIWLRFQSLSILVISLMFRFLVQDHLKVKSQLLIILKIFLFNLSKINFCNGIKMNIILLLRIVLSFIYLNLVVNLMNLLLNNNIMNKVNLISILLIRINLILFWFLFMNHGKIKVCISLSFILYLLFNLI